MMENVGHGHVSKETDKLLVPVSNVMAKHHVLVFNVTEKIAVLVFVAMANNRSALVYNVMIQSIRSASVRISASVTKIRLSLSA